MINITEIISEVQKVHMNILKEHIILNRYSLDTFSSDEMVQVFLTIFYLY